MFDPDEENQLSYTEIHQNYGKLVNFGSSTKTGLVGTCSFCCGLQVESLLESHLDDLGISAEQFVQSCSLESAQSSFHEARHLRLLRVHLLVLTSLFEISAGTV